MAGFDHLPVLLTLAEDADWDIRNSAARGLGRIGTLETRTALLTLACTRSQEKKSGRCRKPIRAIRNSRKGNSENSIW